MADTRRAYLLRRLAEVSPRHASDAEGVVAAALQVIEAMEAGRPVIVAGRTDRKGRGWMTVAPVPTMGRDTP